MHQGLDHHHNISISMHIGGGQFLGGVAATEAEMVQQYCLVYLPACLTLPIFVVFAKQHLDTSFFAAQVLSPSFKMSLCSLSHSTYETISIISLGR